MSIESELAAPFPEDSVNWRIGHKSGNRAMLLAYLDARDVMDRLDDVLGVAGWQDDYWESPSGIMMCRLSCNINGQWIMKSDGAGETKVEAEKGKISDAFKRSAVRFGVGRYLYRLGNTWVDLDSGGKFTPPRLPDWAVPHEKPKPVVDHGKPPVEAYAALERLQERGRSLVEDFDARFERLLKYKFDKDVSVPDLNNRELREFYSDVKDMVDLLNCDLEKEEEENV